MNVFAIGDLHLGVAVNKPMDVFGDKWHGHMEKIAASWREKVTSDDVVLLPGDISWAMRLSDARADFDWVRELPGYKIIIRGNHDYWWASLKKLDEFAGAGFSFIHNNAVRFHNLGVAGTRLWTYPYVRWPKPQKANPAMLGKNPAPRNDDDEKIRASELERLRTSLRALPVDADFKVCMVHYPPVSFDPEENPLTEMLSASGVSLCLYGHVHGLDVAPPAADCTINGVQYLLVSSDYMDFNLRFIKEL